MFIANWHPFPVTQHCQSEAMWMWLFFTQKYGKYWLLIFHIQCTYVAFVFNLCCSICSALEKYGLLRLRLDRFCCCIISEIFYELGPVISFEWNLNLWLKLPILSANVKSKREVQPCFFNFGYFIYLHWYTSDQLLAKEIKIHVTGAFTYPEIKKSMGVVPSCEMSRQ